MPKIYNELSVHIWNKGRPVTMPCGTTLEPKAKGKISNADPDIDLLSASPPTSHLCHPWLTQNSNNNKSFKARRQKNHCYTPDNSFPQRTAVSREVDTGWSGEAKESTRNVYSFYHAGDPSPARACEDRSNTVLAAFFCDLIPSKPHSSQ